jgi:hypothetical protein
LSQPNKADFGLIFGIGVGGQINLFNAVPGKNDYLAEAFLLFHHISTSWGAGEFH